MKDYILVPIDHEANRPKLTARHVLRRFTRFVLGGATVALLAAAFGSLLSISGLVILGNVVGTFLAFGLLGHAWGRPPEEIWWPGAFLGGASGFFSGIVRGGSIAFLDPLLRGNLGFLAHAALFLTWAAVSGLGYRAAQHKNALAALAALAGWRLGGIVSARVVMLLQARSNVAQLAAGPLGSAAQAAVAGFLLACAVVFLCEEPPAPKPS
jgi:hypothetical protein